LLIEYHDPFHALSLVKKATLPRFCIFAASEWSGVAFSFLTHKGETPSMNKPNKKSSTRRIPSRQKNAAVSKTKNGASGKIVETNMPLEEIESGEPPSVEVDALTHYLTEIGRHPLLTIEQEQALARRMRSGDTEAYQRFVEANLRLVVSIAMHYHGPEIPLLDRIQEGNLGLMHAATKFDPDLGVHFSTYATYWIRQSIHRAVLAKARLITLPIRTGEQIVKMNRLHGHFLQTQGYEPSNEEMSQALGMPEEQVLELQRAAAWPLSLDVSPDEERSWADLLEHPSSSHPSQTMTDETLLTSLHYALTLLSPQEREFLELRFGLRDGPTLSFNDLCSHFGMTRTGVQYLEQRALQKLKKILASRFPGVHHLFRESSHEPLSDALAGL
jgi:RNA polymerase primary sigma factor